MNDASDSWVRMNHRLQPIRNQADYKS